MKGFSGLLWFLSELWHNFYLASSNISFPQAASRFLSFWTADFTSVLLVYFFFFGQLSHFYTVPFHEIQYCSHYHRSSPWSGSCASLQIISKIASSLVVSEASCSGKQPSIVSGMFISQLISQYWCVICNTCAFILYTFNSYSVA